MFENLSDLTALTEQEMIVIDGGDFWSDFWDGVYNDLSTGAAGFTAGWHDACGC